MGKIEQNSVCALIPAAGRSSRMKTYKPLLKFNDSQTFIEKIVGEFLTFGCKKIFVIVNQDIYEEVCHLFTEKRSTVEVILNDKLELERFYSIKLGLNKVKEEFCFIHNADNPFIDQEILDSVFTNRISNGYVYPVFKNRGGHPIIISKPIIDHILGNTADDGNFKDIINQFPAVKVDVDSGNILFNLNTKSDYQQLFETINEN